MGNLWQKITAPFKKAGSAVKKTIGDFFAPAPDQVRARDFVRELPGAAETVGKKVLEFGKDILRAGPRAAASTMLSLEGRKEAVPETTMEKFLWGDKPIKDVRSTGEETVKDFGGSQQTAKKYGLPVGIAFAALDMIPVLPEEKAGQAVTEQLIKKYGDDVAKAIIEKGGKKLAEQAIKDGGEKLVEKAGVALLKSEPIAKTAVKESGIVKELPTLFHGTEAENVTKIAEEGFKAGGFLGHAYPQGIYFSTTEKEAENYGKVLAAETGLKPSDFFDISASKELTGLEGDNYASKINDLIRNEAKAKNVAIPTPAPQQVGQYEETIGKLKDPLDISDVKTEVLQKLGYKGFIAPEKGAGKEVVVFDPKDIKILDNLPPNEITDVEKALETINDKAEPVIKAGQETAPADLRLDQAKPAPEGPPTVIEEAPLASAPASTPASALDAIDKMVGKNSTTQTVKDWFKGLPQKFTQAFSDRFAGMKNFEDNLSKMAGKTIDIESSPYVGARMYAGRTGIIESGLEDLQKILSPIRSERPDFTRFILAKRAAERAERGFTNPAAVTASDAMKALEELKTKVGEKTYQLFEKAESAMQDWADRTILKPAADAGIIAKDTYDSILSKNKHWVPFQVLDYLPDQKQADMMKTGGEIFSVSKQGIIKGLESTEKTIRDPFEALIDKVSSAVSLIKRNEVADKLIKLRDSLPEGKDLIQPLEKTATAPKGWGSISVFINGKNTKWAVPEELSMAMHQMNNADAGILGNFLRFTSSAFRKGATNLYIPFSLSNAFRDAQMAVMTSKYGFNAADWVKGFYEGLKGSFGWDSKLLDEFNKSGGGFGGFLQSARDLGGIKNKLFEPSWWRKTKAVINPFNLISNFAEATELAPRLGVFNKALKKGASTLEAAYEARNSTIDFAKAGQEMRIINMWIPFVNARWQALLNTARVFKDRPIRSAAKASALIVIPGVTTYLWNTINYPDLYDDVPQWIKDTYFPIIVGDDKDKNGNRVPKTVLIPKGDVGQIFYNPLEYTMEYIRKSEPSNFGRLALEWMSQLAPMPFTRDGKISTTQILSSTLPPLIKTPIELATNKSFFTDSSIVPGSLENVSPTEQYNEKTPGIAVTAGRALGLSPMKLAYGVEGLLGGFGREIVDPSKILESSVNRFYRSSGGAKTNEAWNLRDEAVTGYNTARQQAKRAIQVNDVNSALKIIDNWNSSVEKMLPDILPYLAQDDPQEADKIRGSVTFSPQDISRLQKSIYNEEMGKSERLGKKPQLNTTDESSSLKQMRQSLKR